MTRQKIARIQGPVGAAFRRRLPAFLNVLAIVGLAACDEGDSPTVDASVDSKPAAVLSDGGDGRVDGAVLPTDGPAPVADAMVTTDSAADSSTVDVSVADTQPVADIQPEAADVTAAVDTAPDGMTDLAVPDAADGATDGGVSADPTAGIVVAPIVWGACPPMSDLDDCARVRVPLDYARPTGPQIELLVARKRATDPARRIGSLFMNPGGPGGSAVAGGFLAAVGEVMSPEIRARFDLVAWDPRGVPGSPAVDCKAMPPLNAIQKTYDLSTNTPQKDALRAAYSRYVDQCKMNDKLLPQQLLPHVGTADTVSDLELLRRAVGDAKLTYLGFSYGTNIGLRYLLRYPERARALVLDGVDGIWTEDVKDTDQDFAFEGALVAFLDWCGKARSADCPFARGTASRLAAFDALAASIKATPLRTDVRGQMFTYPLLTWAVGSMLYAQQLWPDLGAALEAGRRGNGTQLYQAALDYLGPDGPEMDPFNAIGCGDIDPITNEKVEALAVQLKDARLGLAYSRLGCVGWPVANLTPKPGAFGAGVPPVLLMGSTGDPATPYTWAESAAARVPGSRLLTTVSYTHTSYLFGLECVDKAVDAYLLETTLPAAGLRCTSPEPRAMPPGTQPFINQRAWVRPPRRPR